MRLPLAKTAKYQGSFRLNGAPTFNALPPKIRSAIDLKEYKILAKQNLKRSMLIPQLCVYFIFIFYFSSHKFGSTVLSSISCLIVNLLRPALFKLAVYAKSDILEFLNIYLTFNITCNCKQ